MIANAAQSIDVCQRVGGRQSLAAEGCAADRHIPCGDIINVGHRRAGATAHRFGHAVTVGVAGAYCDGFPDLGFLQEVGAGGSAIDGDAVGFPLVADAAQSVDVCQRVGGRQCLALGDVTRDRHTAGGCVFEADVVAVGKKPAGIVQPVEFNRDVGTRRGIGSDKKCRDIAAA